MEKNDKIPLKNFHFSCSFHNGLKSPREEMEKTTRNDQGRDSKGGWVLGIYLKDLISPTGFPNGLDI